MAILRAGPWGNLNSPHEDEPAVIDPVAEIYPVNCAKGDWPNQSWKLVYETQNESTGQDAIGTAALGSPVVVTGVDYAQVFLVFCYQATEEFVVTIEWDIGANGGNPFPSLEYYYNTIEGTTDYFFNTPTDSGTMDITLPASTFGYFDCTIWGDDTSGNTITVEASIL
jgi:hypothetical protein